MLLIYTYFYCLYLLLVLLKCSYFSYSFIFKNPLNVHYRHEYRSIPDSKEYFENALEDEDELDPYSIKKYFRTSKPKVNRRKVVDNLNTYRVQDLDPPYQPGHPRYNALIHLLGIPFDTKEYMIANWLQRYYVNVEDVTFLYEFRGAFLGDAYVRCINTGMQKKIVMEKHMNHFSGRYVEIYPVSESAYRQYYRARYYKKIKGGFYTPLEVLVPIYSDYKQPNININSLGRGDLVIGKIAKITDKGAIIEPLNIDVESPKTIFLLCNNRLSENVTLHQDINENGQIRLIPGMDLNLFFEKIIITREKIDIWDEKSIILNSKEENPNPLTVVYLTMDCTINDNKVEMIEKKIIKS